jgi:MFS family permease
MTNDSKQNPEISIDGQTKKPGLLNQWGGTRALFFTYIHFSHDLTTGLFAAMLPFIRSDMGLNYLQSGFLVSVFAITSGLSQLIGGWAADRIGRRKAITIGLTGIGLSAIAIGLAPSYYALMAILVVMGICSGFYHPSAISAVTTYFKPEQRGRVVALHMIGGSLGFSAGPFIGAILARYYSWHSAYIILGFPALIAAVIVLTKLRLPEPVRQPKGAATAQVDGQKRVGVWQVFASAFAIVAASIVMTLATGPVMSFASLFLVDVHHLTATAGSMWVTIIRLGGLAGSIMGGWLSDKWGRTNTVLLTLILFGPVVFLLSQLSFGIALGAAFIVFGALLTMRETTIQTYLMEKTPPELRATVIGIYFGFGQEGSSIIQPIAGNYMDKIGIGGVYNVIAYIVVGISAIVALFTLRKFRKNKVTVNPINS